MEARKYTVNGQKMTIPEIARKLDVNSKYLYLMTKRKGYDDSCIETYLKKNGYLRNT